MIKGALYIDVIGLGAIALWMGASTFVALAGNADLFQRFGSAGVAVAVAYFALVRHSATAPTGLHERMYWFARTLDYHGRAIRTALSNTTVIASAWKLSAEKEGKKAPQPIEELASNIEHSIAVARMDAAVPHEQVSADLLAGKEKLEGADGLVETVKFRSDIIQMVVIFVATLQWGFGDLLIGQECVPC